MSWHDLAACRGVPARLFYPVRGESCVVAKAICAVCPVRAECLEAGMTEHWGIWGGKSERERRALRRTNVRGSAGTDERIVA